MMKRMSLLGALVLAAPAAHAAELIVTVSGVSQTTGIIRVVVISDPDGNARQNESRNVDAALSQNGVLTTRFLGLSTGLYGIVAVEDKVTNHALEKAVTGSVGAPVANSAEVRVMLAEPKTAVTVPLVTAR